MLSSPVAGMASTTLALGISAVLFPVLLSATHATTVVAASAAALVTLLVIMGCVVRTARQRAWLMTLLSSAVMTAATLWVPYALLQQHDGHSALTLSSIFDNADVLRLGRNLCWFFLTYCGLDAAAGAVIYPSAIGIGYQHHAFYAALLAYVLRFTDYGCVLFLIAAIEEMPTLLKAMSEVRGDRRPRLAVGITVFLFRIAFHVVATYLALSRMTPILYFVSLAVLLQHVTWFRAWFFSRIRAVRAQRTTAPTATALAADDKRAATRAGDAQTATEPADGNAAAGNPPKTTASCTTHTATKDDTSASTSVAPPVVGGMNAHVAMVALMFVAQALLQGSLVWKQLTAGTHDGSALYTAAMMVVHVVAFVVTASRMFGILYALYTGEFIMHSIENQSIIYNISWEDPRVERQLLAFRPDDVILTISSAGCNVLDYLIDGPKAIVACDLNVAQLALLDLKLATVRCMSHADFFRLWAESDVAVFDKHYAAARCLLQLDSSRAYWDGHRAIFADNIMFAGTSGFAARLLQPAVTALGLKRYMDAQKRHAPASLLLTILRKVLAAPWVWAVFAPLGGVPKSQLDLINREFGVWVDRIEEIVGRRMWQPDNYFYAAYICGRWTPDCCPRYLKHHNFQALRQNATRVHLHHGPLASAACIRSDYTIASLLDSMDWMPDDMIAAQLATLLTHMAVSPSGRQPSLFWRSFGTHVHSPVLASLRPNLVPDHDGTERVGWYLSQWLATVPAHGAPRAVAPRVTATATPAAEAEATAAVPAMAAQLDVDYAKLAPMNCDRGVPPNSVWDDVQVMVAMAAHGLRSKKDVKEFYRTQGARYDGFREALLPGRDSLLQYCVPWHNRPRIWLSVGCGTARDIEYVVGRVRAEADLRLYLLDLSPDLLDMARARIADLRLAEQVTLVQGDIIQAYATNGSHLASLPPPGTVDVVTCSYCLTMIPDWRAAVDAMHHALRVGGTLALVDFTTRSDRPHAISQRLNRWWFANDGVWMTHRHTDALKQHPGLSTLWFKEREARVPYTPLVATHYQFAGIKLDQ